MQGYIDMAASTKVSSIDGARNSDPEPCVETSVSTSTLFSAAVPPLPAAIEAAVPQCSSWASQLPSTVAIGTLCPAHEEMAVSYSA